MQNQFDTTDEAITGVTDELVGDARAACQAIRTHRPPARGHWQFDVSVDGVTLAICRTLESALAVFTLGDHPSAGALTRKALEFLYALVILATRKPADAVALLDTWTRKHIGHDVRDALEAGVAPTLFDKEKLIEAARVIGSKVADGKVQRVPEEQLAKWAGLTVVHDEFYPLLNGYAHFQYLEAIDLRNEVREPTDRDIVSNLLLNRAKVAASIQDVALLTLHAMRRLGAVGLDAVLESMNDRFRIASDAVGVLELRRGKLNAKRSGWYRDEPAGSSNGNEPIEGVGGAD